MRKIISRSSLAATLVIGMMALISSIQLARAVEEARVQVLFADPSDVVVQLDKQGGCGSSFFHVKRASENFKEMVAIFMTAFSLSYRVNAYEDSCEGQRNILGHAWTYR
jgi:hypothetical protein